MNTAQVQLFVFFAFCLVVVSSDSRCLTATARWEHKGGDANANLPDPGGEIVDWTPIKTKMKVKSSYYYECPWILDVEFFLKPNQRGCSRTRGQYRQYVRGKFLGEKPYVLHSGTMNTDTYIEDRTKDNQFGVKGPSTDLDTKYHVRTMDAPGSGGAVGEKVGFDLKFLGIAYSAEKGSKETKDIDGTTFELPGEYITHWFWTCNQAEVTIDDQNAVLINNVKDLATVYGKLIPEIEFEDEIIPSEVIQVIESGGKELENAGTEVVNKAGTDVTNIVNSEGGVSDLTKFRSIRGNNQFSRSKRLKISKKRSG